MTKQLSPERWAYEISNVLKVVLDAERLPVDIKAVAKEYSGHKFPDDPITMIRGDNLPGFEGALVQAPADKKGWGILYNDAITSPGRINFTLAHEFGHYLLHRRSYPKGLQCSRDDMASWESEYGQLEHQANVFAATLLMPLDDFRTQIDPKSRPCLDSIGTCADRYNVSLIAATLRWLQYTQRRSMLVISKDDFILWSRSSVSALKSGLYYKTRKQPPIEISASSLPRQPELIHGVITEAEHDSHVWLNTPCKEFMIMSRQYDFMISLLHFGDEN